MRLTFRRVLMVLIAINVAAILVVLKSLTPFSKTPSMEALMNNHAEFPTPSPTLIRSASPSPSRAAAAASQSPGASKESRVGPCPGLSAPPAHLVSQQQFFTVDNTDQVHVHSAFYDNTTLKARVRLVIIRRMVPTAAYSCQVWFRTPDPYLLIVAAVYKRIPEEHGRRHAGGFLTCPLQDKERPYAVSIVTSSCDKPTHVLPVQYNAAILSNFTICVTPLNFRYSRTYELVEMLELNSILGADRFVFYNYSTSPNVDEVLRYYGSQGKVEVVQWHLPMKVDTWPPSGKPDIHYFGQLPALNDCLYRNLGRARHLVYTDLDEFIVPRKVRDWPALLASEQKLSSRSNGAIFFRCVFFRKEWPLWEEDFEDKQRATRFNATTLLRVFREKTVLKGFVRSKFIIKPEAVETVGIHNVWSYKSASGATIDPSVGILHHYRSWEDPSDFKSKQMVDTHMHAYKTELLDRLQQVWTQLPHAMGAAEPSTQKRK